MREAGESRHELVVGPATAGGARRGGAFLGVFVVVAAVTAMGKLLSGRTQIVDVAMIYLLGIVLLSLRWGLWPSLVGAVLSVIALDFFFIPPFHTLAVHDVSHLATVAVMFTVALVISGLTKVRARLAEQAQQAQVRVETEELRNALLSSVSHDLRTPLAIITGTASTLLDDKVDPAVRRDLTESILGEAERLDRLVRNVLDLTRLQAGAVDVRKEWQSVEEAVGAALERVGPILGVRPIHIDVPADLPLVPYDSILLQQVLVNLLENAAKYAPGGTELSISASASPVSRPSPLARERSTAPSLDGPTVVEICVADRGPGLAREDEARVFEKFYRAGKGRGGGVGLGLTICNAIITAHGGRIWAANRDGGGASFRFTLPIEGKPPLLDSTEPTPLLSDRELP